MSCYNIQIILKNTISLKTDAITIITITITIIITDEWFESMNISFRFYLSSYELKELIIIIVSI